MASEILVRRSGARLEPIDAVSEEIILALPEGATIGATVRQKRNLAHHRKYWALMRVVWDHQALYPTTEKLSDGIKLACGLTEMVLDPVTLLESRAPASIAFDKMDQKDFEQFYERATDIIVKRIVPGVDRADLEREVNSIIDGRKS